MWLHLHEIQELLKIVDRNGTMENSGGRAGYGQGNHLRETSMVLESQRHDRMHTLEVKSDNKVCSLLYPSIRKGMSTVEYLKSTPKFNKTFKTQAFRGQLLLAFCFIFFPSFLFNGFKPTGKLQEQNKELPHPFHPGSPLPLTILPQRRALSYAATAQLSASQDIDVAPHFHPVHRP